MRLALHLRGHRAALLDDQALHVRKMGKAARLVERLGRQDAHSIHAQRKPSSHVGETAECLVGLQEDNTRGALIGPRLPRTHGLASCVRSANMRMISVWLFVVRGNNGYQGSPTQSAKGALFGQLRKVTMSDPKPSVSSVM